MTTSNEQFIKGSKSGLPVTYERKKPPKSQISEDVLWKADIVTFKNRIGFLTNLSSSFYGLRDLFSKSSIEYKTITDRIKISSSLQGLEIDRGKGVQTFPIPENWSKWRRWKEEDSDEDKERINLYNSIVANKRPMYMRFLYSHFDKEYKKHFDLYDLLSMNRFGMSLEELLKKENKSKEEQKWATFYIRYGHLVDSPSVMNRISKLMKSSIDELRKVGYNHIGWKFSTDEEKQSRMRTIYGKWKKSRITDDDGSFSNEFSRMAYDITTNSKEIARLSLNCSTAFAINVFYKETLDLLKKNKVRIPVLDDEGSFVFNNDRYSILELELINEWESS